MFEELKAMKKIIDILADLEPSERKRALTWVTAKLAEEDENDGRTPRHAKLASYNDSDSLSGAQRGEDLTIGQ